MERIFRQLIEGNAGLAIAEAETFLSHYPDFLREKAAVFGDPDFATTLFRLGVYPDALYWANASDGTAATAFVFAGGGATRSPSQSGFAALFAFATKWTLSVFFALPFIRTVIVCPSLSGGTSSTPRRWM